MKHYFTVAVLIMGMASAAIAQGHGRMTMGSHMRPQLFHDRTPHVHPRTVQQHSR